MKDELQGKVKILDTIIIDLKGKFAHFRKFYTNSSSMSYSVPPRTAVMGIIAAILGYERDSYYDLFAVDKLNVSLRKMNSTRNIMQTVNYIKATDVKSVLTPKEHTQIPFEIVTGGDGVHYRLYINHTDKKIMDTLFQRCSQKAPAYSPYLGTAPFGCGIQLIDRIDAQKKQCDGYVEISSIIGIDDIDDQGILFGGNDITLMKENMPREIYEGRVIGKAKPYIFDNHGRPLKVKIRDCYYNAVYGDINENIVFM